MVIQKDCNLKYMDTGKDVAFTRRIWISAQHHKRGRKSCSESCQCQLVSGELVCDQNETLELKYFSKEEKLILQDVLNTVVMAVECIIKDTPSKAMNKYNN